MNDPGQRNRNVRRSVASGASLQGGTFGRGDFPQALLRGSTAHFKVYSTPGLGKVGARVANYVLSVCEADFAKISRYFEGITPATLPINVIIANLRGLGGYHHGCAAADLYCDVRTKPRLIPRATAFAYSAELVEVFEAAQAGGWDCAKSNGESLSRVLAATLYPSQLNAFATAH